MLATAESFNQNDAAMKHLPRLAPLLLLALVCAHSAHAQAPEVIDPVEVKLAPNEDGLYEFVQVYEAPGSADKLYKRANRWVVLSYRSADHVLQLEDPDAHTIIAKGFSQTREILTKINIWHVLQIDTKDGRYRVSYSSFTYEDANGVAWSGRRVPFEKKVSKKVKRKAEEFITAALSGLAKAMNADDDW